MRSLLLCATLVAACPAAPEKASTDPAIPAAPAPAAEPVAAPAPPPASRSAAMTDPSLAKEQAPDTFAVKLATTQGDMIIDVTRAWAPNGADRFYNLVKIGYFDDVAFFRVIEGFMAQVGIHGDPAVNRVWRDANITDDPVKESNKAGFVTFATAGPNTRTTQIFFNFGDNANLDGMGFSPFGKLRDMDVLNKLYSGYGEGAPMGAGPHQGMLQERGNDYLKEQFPSLDYIKNATLL